MNTPFFVIYSLLEQHHGDARAITNPMQTAQKGHQSS